MNKKRKLIIGVVAALVIVAGIAIFANVRKKDPLTYTYSPYKSTSTKTGSYNKYLENVEKIVGDLTSPSKTYYIDGTDYKQTSTIDVIKTVQKENEDGVLVPTKVHETSTRDTSLEAILKVIDKKSNFYENENYDDTDVLHQTSSLLLIKDRGQVVYETKGLEEGYYNIYVKYFSTSYESTRSAVEKQVTVITENGDVNSVFNECMASQSYVFSRNWGNPNITNDTSLKDNTEKYKWFTLAVAKDLNGNDIKPTQTEMPTYMTQALKDDMGYTPEAYKYYLTANSQIVISAIKEYMMIDYIKITPVKEELTYEEYLEKHAGDVNEATSEYAYRIEAETATTTSSPTLSPVTDRTSSATYPYSVKETKLNSIGGDSWKVLGDWVSWKFTVDKAGFYNISLRSKQNLVRGMYSTRIVYIDDEVPFKELNQTVFSYSSKWENITLGTADTPYRIYLTPGEHTIKMEVTLGDYGALVEEIQSVINDLNGLYLDIIKFTTTSPDASRTYDLHKKEGLNLLTRLEDAYTRLEKTSKGIEEISSSKSDKTGVIDVMVDQLKDFYNRPRTIPSRLSQFNTNISSLGSLLIELREFPLMIDYLVVYAADGGYKLPKANENFFKKIWNGIVGFIYSFIVDYSSIGATTETTATEEIDVWMTLGRDQANVIRKLIDESFSDVKVNIKLTGTDVLLKAALAGVGPDVAINVDSTLPVNYGLRGAALDLKLTFGEEFDNFVAENFQPSVMRQFTFTNRFYTDEKGENPDGVYAVPEKQIYMMMSVRPDFLADKYGSDIIVDPNGEEHQRYEYYIPNTWDDVINLVADLQTDSLQYYLPVNDVGASALSPVFVSLLYQTGGRLYINDNKETGLLQEVAMNAFEKWTNFYTLYSFPKFASFTNRFRSGEMPLGLSYYEMYNTLSVFAPEIRGNWSFYPIPGSKRTIDLITNAQTGAKETIKLIDHTSTATGTGAIILPKKGYDAKAKNNAEIYGNAWKFLKWWTSGETQARFGQEMEGILGSAARHATANINAFQRLSWPNDDLKVLLKQWNVVQTSDKATAKYIIVKESNDTDVFYHQDSGVECTEAEKIYYYYTYDIKGNKIMNIYGVRELPQIAGSYITGREVENAYRKVINNLANAKETLYDYALNINNEIDRKRTEFGLPLRTDYDE